MYLANRNPRTVEYTVGVIIPCMAPFAKLYKHMMVSVKTYASNRSYLRTNSLTGDCRSDSMEKKNVTKGNQESHTNTIDKMLARMFPGGDSLSVQLSSMGRGVFKLTVKFQFPNT
jgi:hypothetical protein